MSFFSWLDYSEHDRRKALDVISLFRERETRDELGIGARRRAEAEQQGRSYRPRRDPRQAKPSPRAQRNFTETAARCSSDKPGNSTPGPPPRLSGSPGR